MKKRILQIFVLLLAVVFLTTTAYAGKKKYKRWRSWNPFKALWSAIYDLSGQVDTNKQKIVDLAAEMYNKVKSDATVGPQGPKGDTGPQGPKGDTGPQGTAPRLICGGCQFSDSKFQGYDFGNEAYLQQSVFNDSDLSDAKLPGADLRMCSFIRTVLIGADLPGADLSNSWMMGADLTGADLTGATLTGVMWLDPYGVNGPYGGHAICPNGLPADDASNGGVCRAL